MSITVHPKKKENGMKPKTVITQWIHPEIIEFMSSFCTVVANQTRETLPHGKIIDLTKDAEAIMVFMSDTVDDAFLQKCPKLKIVSAALKGYDNFDVDACTWNGVWFSIVPDLLTIPTAELAVGLLIGISRNLVRGDDYIRKGKFSGWTPNFYGRGLKGSTAGIIGMGGVGMAIASLLKGFGVKIIFSDPGNILSKTGSDFIPVNLNDLFQSSDFILVATPYLPSTKHLINEDSLRLVKPEACLINIGRGSCVDETAVARALAKGKLAGYAADVFEFEDWARQERSRTIHKGLLSSEKTFLTPHLGSAVDSVRYEIAMQAALNIQDVFSCKKPRNAVNDTSKILAVI